MHKTVKEPSRATKFRKKQSLIDKLSDDDLAYLKSKVKNDSSKITKKIFIKSCPIHV